MRALTRSGGFKVAAKVAYGVAGSLALVAVVMFSLADGNQPAPGQWTTTAKVVDHICPLASCAGYPDPSQVRGITISALQNWLLFGKSMREQMRAMQVWHANTVRFQILQDKLVGAGGRNFSPQYMKDIRDMTDYALKRGLTVVLNAQTEMSLAYVKDESLPSFATKMFWQHIARYYGKNPHVVFDLFNEPRHCTWGQWQNAMQGLVDYVRSVGAQNQLWAEGIWWGSTLGGVPLLHGQGIVYSFHHPGSPWPWQLPVSTTTWWDAFGYLTAHGIPVVDGEFVNYLGGYYWPHSTQVVSQYFRYLQSHHIGMVAWTLQSGIMTANASFTSAISEPQGAGRLVMRYFNGRLFNSQTPQRRVYVKVSHRQSRKFRRKKSQLKGLP